MADDAKTPDEAPLDLGLSQIPPYPDGLCAYLFPDDGHAEEAALALVREVQQGGVWFTCEPLELRGEKLLALALRGLKQNGDEGGAPVLAPDMARTLSESRSPVVELLVTPEAAQSAVGLFHEGKRVYEARTDPLPQSAHPLLDRLKPEDLAENPTIEALGLPLSGERSRVLHGKQMLAAPAGTSLGVDIFRFSERNSACVDEEEDDGGRACLIAFDQENLQRDLARSVAGVLQILQFYFNPEAKRFLGPMSADLPQMADELRQLEANLPLRRAAGYADIVELLALVSTRLSTPGNRLAYLDQVFFPLLNVAPDAVPEVLDADELPAMEEMDITVAMADQLPYFAPEGELMESIADDELVPLLSHLGIEGEEGGGSVWVLRPERLRRRLEELTPLGFRELFVSFGERWWDARQMPDDAARKAWANQRLELDTPALQTFFASWNEMKTLLTMAELNHLEVALLFYE